MADVEKIEAELRAGLEAASKGAWQEGAGWVFIDPIDPERNPTHALRNLLRDVPDDELQANVKHIVAAQPEKIRALLDELDRLREERDMWKGRAEAAVMIGRSLTGARALSTQVEGE